jgi:hypothetical protein
MLRITTQMNQKLTGRFRENLTMFIVIVMISIFIIYIS